MKKNSVAVAGLVLAVVTAGGCGKSAAPRPVEAAEPAAGPQTAGEREVVLDGRSMAAVNLRVEPAQRRALPMHFEANGRITANENRTWYVGAITAGRVMRLVVNVGDRVERQQVLAGMHSHDIHEARAEYRKAERDVLRFRAAVDLALKQRDRYRRLQELKAASQEQVDLAEGELERARGALANGEVELERTRRHLVEFLEVSLDHEEPHETGEFPHDGDLIPVKAPASGVILRRNVSVGSVVNPGDVLFQIADLRTVWMVANVQEEYLGKLRLGIPVSVRVQAYPEQAFQGRITRVGDQLDAETRTIPVRVELANPHSKLKPEMYATAEIAAGATAEAVFLPQEAPQQMEGRTVVFVETAPGRFLVREIETGRLSDGWVEVRQGVAPGERVVTRGGYMLKSQLLKGAGGE